MIQFDGSYHDWFEGRCIDKGFEKEQCLLVSIDDATNRIIKLKFEKNEGKKAVFGFWKEYILKHGKPLNIYLDKFATYKVNHQNAENDKEMITHFKKSMDQLNINLIFAHSPQAKGRVERSNKTLQDRLIKEMRLRKLKSIDEANEYLEKEFIPYWNSKFSLKAKKEANLHNNLGKIEKDKLNHIFSIKYERRVRNDFVISFKNQYLQLKQKQSLLNIYKKDLIIVEEDILNNRIYLKKRNKYLDYFVLNEKPKKEENLKLSVLTTSKSNYKPPKNHPWRIYEQKEFLRSKVKC